MQSKNVPTIDIQVKDRNRIEVVLLGDVHYGHEACATQQFLETIEHIKKRDIYAITMGDLIEISIEGHILGSMFSQTMNPLEQRKDVIKALKPIKKKILGMITGNHEISRGWKLNSIDPTEDMASFLETQYWKDGGYVIINLKDGRKTLQSYVLAIFHGIGESQTPQYLINKARSIYPEADVIAMGHTHILASGTSHVLGLNAKTSKEYRKKLVWVRTGGYLDGARYANLKMYPLSAIGSPKIILEVNKKAVYVNMIEY